MSGLQLDAVMIRTVQGTMAVAGIGCLISLLDDTEAFPPNNNLKDFLVKTYMFFVLGVFGLGILLPICNIFLLFKDRRPNWLVWPELVTFLLWGGVSVSLFLQLQKKGCMNVKTYSGACAIAVPIAIAAAAECLLDLGTTVIVHLRKEKGNGGGGGGGGGPSGRERPPARPAGEDLDSGNEDEEKPRGIMPPPRY